MNGADGVLLVCPSVPTMLGECVTANDRLERALRHHKLDLRYLPHVILYNQWSDHPMLEPAELDKILNQQGAPSYPCYGPTGEGVMNGVWELLFLVLQTLNKKHGSGARRSLGPTGYTSPPPSRPTRPRPVSPRSTDSRPAPLRPQASRSRPSRPSGAGGGSQMSPSTRPPSPDEVEVSPTEVAVDLTSRRLWWERILSPDVARPGPLERLVAQTEAMVHFLQATIGLHVVFWLSVLDRLVQGVTGAFHQIYQWGKDAAAWRRSGSADRGKYRARLYQESVIIRYQMARVFSFPGFCPHRDLPQELSPGDKRDLFAPQVTLSMVFEVRRRLDDILRETQFLTTRQKMIKAKKWALSWLPNPISIWGEIKNYVVLFFWGRYNRHQVEERYADLTMSLHRLYLELRDHPDERPVKWLGQWEEELVETAASSGCVPGEKGLDEAIETVQDHLSTGLVMLSQPARAVEPRRWDRWELVEHVAKDPSSSRSSAADLELERWLTREVARIWRGRGEPVDLEEKTLRAEEKRDRMRRYRLSKKLEYWNL